MIEPIRRSCFFYVPLYRLQSTMRASEAVPVMLSETREQETRKADLIAMMRETEDDSGVFGRTPMTTSGIVNPVIAILPIKMS